MTAPDMKVIDIDPRGLAAYREISRRISHSFPLAVLWHEDGIPRRFVLDNEPRPFGLSRVMDARRSAMTIHENHGHLVKRVIVTDRRGYDSLCRAQSLIPGESEPKYEYLGRVIDNVNSVQSESLGIYPPLSLDRGPLDYRQMRAFVATAGVERVSFLLVVFNGDRMSFSFVFRAERSRIDLVTSLDHWRNSIDPIGFSAESLDKAVGAVASELGLMAGALFIQERDFNRLYDGKRHESLPGSLILGGRAFGYSHLPGVPEEAMFHTAGLLAYVPDWMY